MSVKVLFVDDDRRVLSVMRRYFVRESFKFYSARNSKEGLRKALEVHPDIILLDVALPDIGGFEVCRRLKADCNTKAIPVVFISGKYCSEYDKLEGFKIGADDYILKSTDIEEVIVRTRAIIRGYAMGNQRAMEKCGRY